MMCTTVGSKDRKDRKRVMRDEMSNLGVVVGGAGVCGGGSGHRVRGGWSYGDNGASGGGSFKTKDMRKRKVEALERGQKLPKKKKGAVNTYQKSSYGGRSGVAVPLLVENQGRGNE